MSQKSSRMDRNTKYLITDQSHSTVFVASFRNTSKLETSANTLMNMRYSQTVSMVLESSIAVKHNS